MSKSFSLIGSFRAKYILFELKSTEDLSFMTLRTDEQFVEELAGRFNIDMKNLTDFDLSIRKSQKSSL